MKFCSNCGSELLAIANFCPSCGNKIVRTESQPAAESSHLENSNPLQSNQTDGEQSSEKNQRASKTILSTAETTSTAESKSVNTLGAFTPAQKKILIGSLVVFVIVILSIVGFKSNLDSDEQPTSDSGLSNTYIDESGAVVPFDSAAAIEEEVNAAQTAAITEKNIAIRNNWEDYITVSRSGFKYSELGGISDLSIIVTNKTEHVMDRVYVDVDIKTANGYNYKTEHLLFEQIKPFSRQELMVPPTTRGKTVEYRITNIYSNSLNFKWDEGDHTGNGSLNDPWKTND